MGQILIRNLDDETIAAYREAAQRNNRSLEAEVRLALTLAKPITPKRRDELIALSERLRGMTPQGVRQTPAEILIREDRDGSRDA